MTSISPPEKVCRVCGESKPIEAFYPRPGAPDGHRNDCIPCNNADSRARNASQHEQRTASRRAYHQAHREENLAKFREYDAAHAAERAAYMRAYRAEDPARHRATQKRSQQRRKDAVKANMAKQRAWRRRAEGRYTAADVARLKQTQQGLCAYCGQPYGDDYHIDHKTPLSRGGSNWPDNLAITCPPCNFRKHAKTDAEFLALLAAAH